MSRVHHTADRSDQTQATKGINAWKYYGDYSHVPKVVQPVHGLSAGQLMINSRDGISEPLKEPPARSFIE